MDQNISFEGGGLKISEEVIKRTINMIFPGNNYLDSLVLIFFIFLIGIITLTIFFYFSKKFKMFKSMPLLVKGFLSIIFGGFSFIIVVLTNLPFILMGYDPLQLTKTSSLLPIMLISGFLLWVCLVFASYRYNGRQFLLKTLRYMSDFLLVVTLTFLMIILFIKTKDYVLLLWIIVDLIYIFERLKKPKLIGKMKKRK